MIPDREATAIAWMAFEACELLVWPFVTLALGLAGASLWWSAAGAAPLVIVEFATARRRHPSDPIWIPVATMAVMFGGAMLALYFVGALVRPYVI